MRCSLNYNTEHDDDDAYSEKNKLNFMFIYYDINMNDLFK